MTPDCVGPLVGQHGHEGVPGERRHLGFVEPAVVEERRFDRKFAQNAPLLLAEGAAPRDHEGDALLAGNGADGSQKGTDPLVFHDPADEEEVFSPVGEQ